jgi:hypothetical protein
MTLEGERGRLERPRPRTGSAGPGEDSPGIGGRGSGSALGKHPEVRPANPATGNVLSFAWLRFAPAPGRRLVTKPGPNFGVALQELIGRPLTAAESEVDCRLQAKRARLAARAEEV